MDNGLDLLIQQSNSFTDMASSVQTKAMAMSVPACSLPLVYYTHSNVALVLDMTCTNEYEVSMLWDWKGTNRT